jgi:hypothetical protein
MPPKGVGFPDPLSETLKFASTGSAQTASGRFNFARSVRKVIEYTGLAGEPLYRTSRAIDMRIIACPHGQLTPGKQPPMGTIALARAARNQITICHLNPRV